jgi:hypothetical protein
MILTTEPTTVQMSRVQAEWSEYAGEALTVECITGTLYAYGSELAMRRLAHRMRSFNVNWSENLKTWYFSSARN